MTTTVKSLLLLVVLFVWMVQMSKVPATQPIEVQSNTDEATNDKTIAEFREEVKKNNEVAFIRRENGQDMVKKDANGYTRRTITVSVDAYYVKVHGSKFRFFKKDFWRYSYEKDFQRMKSLFEMCGLIPDIVESQEEGSIGTESVLQEYYKYKRNEEIEDAIESFLKNTNTTAEDRDKGHEKDQLANFIVPLARTIFTAYDGAVNYITKEYHEHCLKSDGIVQRNKLYYRIVWWSSVTRSSKHLNEPFSQDDLTVWEEYMSTACPFPKEEIKLLHHLKVSLTLENFEQMVAVPEPVAILWPHLPMIEHLSTNCELIDKLVETFNEYNLVVSNLYSRIGIQDENTLTKHKRKEHDDNLWIGYQKKLIILQTIIRVMREDEVKATNYLKDEMEKFRVWRDKWPSGPIPPPIVFVVARALYRSKHFQVYSKPIVQMALTFLFEGADVQFEPIKEKPSDGDFKDREVTIPEEIKIFCTKHLTSDKLLYSSVMDALVDRFQTEGTETYKDLKDLLRNEAWSELVLTIVPEIVELSPDGTFKPDYDVDKSEKSEVSLENTKEKQNYELTPNVSSPEKNKENKTKEQDEELDLTPKPTWCGSGLVRWVKENKCDAAIYSVLALSAIGAIFALGYYTARIWNGESPTSEPFRNITLPTEDPAVGTGALPLKLVWWIVAVMAIGAIVYCVYCLVRRKRRSTDEVQKNNRKDDAKKDKNEPQGGQVGNTPNGPTRGTPTSAINTGYITPSKYDPKTLSIWNAWFGTKPPKSAINKLNDGRQGSQIQSSQGANSRISSLDSGVVSSSPNANSSTTSLFNSPLNASSTVGASSAPGTSKISSSNVSPKSSATPSTVISATSPSSKVKPPAKKSPSQVPKSPSPSNSPRGKAQSPTGKNITKPGDPKKGAQKKQSKK